MPATAPLQGSPMSDEQVASILDRFYRDGFAHVPGVLTPDEVAGLRERIDRAFDDPRMTETDNQYGPFVMVRLFELDTMFRDMLVREPIIGLAEAVLGTNCHIIAQNVVRNRPGEAIDTFHVDDHLEFPVAEGMARHDPRLHMPVNLMTVQIALTDTLDAADGPSQYVPGSHYAGREPNDGANPTFEERGAVNVHCRAGDIYLHNGQCWHRGAPNRSDRTRYLLQHAYGRRWVAQRFYPFLNYRMPDHVLHGSGERLLRVLGKHPKGAYG